MRNSVVLSNEMLEQAKDPRPCSELLAGLPHFDESDKRDPFWTLNRYYQYYAGLARLVRPESVLEIGVKYGFSLVSFWRGFPEIRRIVGIDPETWVKESQRLALENLKAAGCAADLSLPVGFSYHEFPGRRNESYDLVNVDGQHSYINAISDVLCYWHLLAPGGTMIVDDMQVEGVKRAVADAERVLDRVAVSFETRGPHTGWRVLQKAAPENK